jgi:hypothetical protein
MSDLTDRLRAYYPSIRSDLMHDAADMFDAIDALLVTYSAGPPEMAPLLNDLYLILHPEEGL